MKPREPFSESEPAPDQQEAGVDGAGLRQHVIPAFASPVGPRTTAAHPSHWAITGCEWPCLNTSKSWRWAWGIRPVVTRETGAATVPNAGLQSEFQARLTPAPGSNKRGSKQGPVRPAASSLGVRAVCSGGHFLFVAVRGPCPGLELKCERLHLQCGSLRLPRLRPPRGPLTLGLREQKSGAPRPEARRPRRDWARPERPEPISTRAGGSALIGRC